MSGRFYTRQLATLYTTENTPITGVISSLSVQNIQLQLSNAGDNCYFLTQIKRKNLKKIKIKIK